MPELIILISVGTSREAGPGTVKTVRIHIIQNTQNFLLTDSANDTGETLEGNLGVNVQRAEMVKGVIGNRFLAVLRNAGQVGRQEGGHYEAEEDWISDKGKSSR